jgi:hypothetical protein
VSGVLRATRVGFGFGRDSSSNVERGSSVMAEVKRARPDGNLPKRDVNDHRGGSKVVLVWLRWLYCMHRCIFSILNFLHPRFSLLVCIDSSYEFTNLLNQPTTPCPSRPPSPHPGPTSPFRQLRSIDFLRLHATLFLLSWLP